MIKVDRVSHFYGKEEILKDINLTIEDNSFNIIIGESGSGKTTLLSIMSTLLTPTKGDVYFTTNIHHNSIDNFRNQHIGFIFQFHYLIAHLTILENIQMVTKKSKKEIIDLLNRLKISKLAKKYPSDISGGERQRVAIARAIINDPQYIFADEPTGNLDSKNSKIIFDILRNIDATVLVVTHNSSFIKSNDRVIEIKDGVIL